MSKHPFINRDRELHWLQERYVALQTEAQLLVVYGKRRVGKTELIHHFIQDKPHVYYLADRGSATLHLRSAISVLTQTIGPTPLSPTAFTTWREFFDYLGTMTASLKQPLILVFDEFPYLAEAEPAISSYFQYGWEKYFKNQNIMIILMGSSISMMYTHTLARSAPLYGRRTGQWLLQPFSYQETKRFYPNCPFSQTFPLYALSGGIPAYARIFDGHKNLQQNIAQSILPEGSFLSVEPELILNDEFDDPRSYLGILKAIGLGRTKFSEIAQTAQIPLTSLPTYLQNLIQLRMIKKEIPITDTMAEKSKRGTYSLSDAFLRFYFSFIYPNLSVAKAANPQVLFRTQGEQLIHLVAKAYEDASVEFIQSGIDANLVPPFDALGRWWNKDTEIDLVGLHESSNTILFVETKWSTRPIGPSILYDLQAKAQQVIWGKPQRTEIFGLISKGGFTKQMQTLARQTHVLLIEQDQVLNSLTPGDTDLTR